MSTLFLRRTLHLLLVCQEETMNEVSITNCAAIDLLRQREYPDALRKLVLAIRMVHATLREEESQKMQSSFRPIDSLSPQAYQKTSSSLYSVSLNIDTKPGSENSFFDKAFSFSLSNNEYAVSAALMFNSALLHQLIGGDTGLKKAIALYEKVVALSEANDNATYNGVLLATFCNLAHIHMIQESHPAFLAARSDFVRIFNDGALKECSERDAAFFCSQFIRLGEDSQTTASLA